MNALTSISFLLYALPLSFIACTMMRMGAKRFGLLDHPGGHKGHDKPVPLGGGVGIFLAIAIPLLAGILAHLLGLLPLVRECYIAEIHQAARTSWLNDSYPPTLGILAAGAALCLLGLIDDRKSLGPWLKLWVQIVCASAVVGFCDVRILTLAGELPSIVITILWIVALTNSFNFLDNMDGLAGGVGLICAITLCIIAMMMDQALPAILSGVMAGALAGFLPHNLAPAKLFMGDAGSLVMGFWLACCSCMVTYAPAEGLLAVGWLIPLCIMAVPIYDTLSVFYLRWRRGESIMVGDRRHFSHRLLKRGLSVRQAAATIYIAAAVCCSGAVILASAGSLLVAGVVGVQILAVLVLIGMLEAIWKVED